MARTKKNVERAAGRTTRPKKASERRDQSAKEPSRREMMGMVCNLLCQGVDIIDIKRQVKDKYGVDISRETPYRMFRDAARGGHLQYVAPKADDLYRRMKGQYRFLKSISVIETTSAEDISLEVAKTIMEMMWHHRRPASLSIGFAGGSLLRLTAKRLSDLLRVTEPDELPRELVLRALSSGLDSRDMTSQPNAIFSYFSEDHHLPLKVSFVGLPAPGLVTEAQMKDLTKNYVDIRSAFDHKGDIDILVTSAGGCWEHGHSALYNIYQTLSPESIDQLNDKGCIGDLMWRPFGVHGPLEIQTDKRVMTLVELSDLARFVKNNRRVILSIAPCGKCRRDKAELLRAILACSPPLITDLIADSRSVSALLPGR
jgi:DNA-binding transcriptional regulator LsrR (DeoR family)